MRNMPPTPANYWQRAGRAGRRHRLAVNITYARPASHDRAYFTDPLRLLGGRVLPPRFNLRNPELVRKHVHATTLTALHRLASPAGGLGESERDQVMQCLAVCFPPLIREYLLEANGNLRTVPADTEPLRQVIAGNRARLLDIARSSLAATWPADDAAVVTQEQFGEILDQMPDQLMLVIRRLWSRMQWALRQMDMLNERRRQRGALEEEEQALFRRCERLVAKMRCEVPHGAAVENLQDVATFSVLAAEGFLPGYGLEASSILGTAQMPLGLPGAPEYLLPRPPAMALREYVPGNLIYANQHKFVPRTYHLETSDPLHFRINLANDAIIEGAGTGGADCLPLLAIPICDVDFAHSWHIQDEEEHRFQLPVMVLGSERGSHAGGTALVWGSQSVHLRKGVALRLVNIGVESLIRSQNSAGYPICLVSGQTRSPLASEHELEKFRNRQRERYNRDVVSAGFYADIVADALSVPGCPNREVAYSVMECLRLAAAQTLDMEVEDLQVLCIGEMDGTLVDGLLYDPMIGGSGLLDQMVTNWDEIVRRAVEIAETCASRCGTACIDCLLHFRNAFYHRHLNRHTAREFLTHCGETLTVAHEIPPRVTGGPAVVNTGDEMTATLAEQRFLGMLRRAGFPEPECQRTIPLGHPYGHTIPDFFYPDETERTEGMCIYVDGLSRHIHGNPATHERDVQLRNALRQQHYEVMEIPVSYLSDREAMSDHFYRLGRFLVGRTRAEEIRADGSWFA